MKNYASNTMKNLDSWRSNIAANVGTLNISASTFTGSGEGKGCKGTNGGAVYFEGDTLKITNTKVQYCVATGINDDGTDEMYKVEIASNGLFTIYAPGGTDEAVDWSKSGVTEVVQQAMKFSDDTVGIYTILNQSAIKRKVILKKVNGENEPIEGISFRIFRRDLSEITEGQTGGKYTLGKSGVYFIGKLPLGRYYLVEETPQKIFILDINMEGLPESIEPSDDLQELRNTLLSCGTTPKDVDPPEGE